MYSAEQINYDDEVEIVADTKNVDATEEDKNKNFNKISDKLFDAVADVNLAFKAVSYIHTRQSDMEDVNEEDGEIAGPFEDQQESTELEEDDNITMIRQMEKKSFPKMIVLKRFLKKHLQRNFTMTIQRHFNSLQSLIDIW